MTGKMLILITPGDLAWHYIAEQDYRPSFNASNPDELLERIHQGHFPPSTWFKDTRGRLVQLGQVMEARVVEPSDLAMEVIRLHQVG